MRNVLTKPNVMAAALEWLTKFYPEAETITHADKRSAELDGRVVWGVQAAGHWLLITISDDGEHLDVHSEHCITGDTGPFCQWSPLHKEKK